MGRVSPVAIVVTLSLGLLMLVACAEKSPEQRVAQARARYEATLNGFVVQQQPVASAEVPPVEGEPSEAEGGASQEGMTDVEGSGETAEAPVDLSQNVLLDIVIRHDSFDKLDGITVDITMAEGERELQVWRVW